ncbi:MAG: winged helix-turn-helix transcriptional regulator [Acidiferrobacterales bacterium]|nr:winged helix-turn-helix transcriptional regulator [Acidiferrobacterales bacterium]
MKRNLDITDRRILDELQANGRLPIVELAKRVHLTKTPCTERVKRLEKLGIISGYSANLDAARIGLSHLTIVHVSLTQTSDTALVDFNEEVKRIPEIEVCQMLAGQFDYMLIVRCRNMGHFRDLLGDRISKLPNLLQTHSFAVMETVKDTRRIAMTNQDSSHFE